jgi:hypothetical protein
MGMEIFGNESRLDTSNKNALGDVYSEGIHLTLFLFPSSIDPLIAQGSKIFISAAVVIHVM